MEFEAAQQVEHRKKELKPVPGAAYAQNVLREHWGIETAHIQPIESYDDFNFCVEDTDGVKHLLKFFNGVESANAVLLEGYSAMMAHLTATCTGLQFQSARRTVAGADVAFVTDCPVFCGEAGVPVAVRALSWILGATMSAAGATPELLFREGVAVGRMSLALRGFEHQGLSRLQFWDGQHFLTHVSPFLPLLDAEEGLRDTVLRVMAAFRRDVLPFSAQLPRSCIMGDCNDANIIVTEGPDSDVRGFIDFGDAVHSWGVLEIANAMVSSGCCTDMR